MKGLAAVSRNDNPLAITNSAARNRLYCPACAAGQNIMHPVPSSTNPVTIPVL